MVTFDKSWLWLWIISASATVYAQPPLPGRYSASMVGQMPAPSILQQMGAELELGSTPEELDGYASQFARTDADRDGKHTKTEYVDRGGYMTPQARAGIFRAADGNADGVVTQAEYVLNRIITDEAKTIVQGMDDDKDGLVERAEFVRHAAKLLSDMDLADKVYAALDTNADGKLPIPEYLRVWGQWARSGQPSAEARIAARRAELAVAKAPANCPACAMGLTAAFVFKRLDVNADGTIVVEEFQRSPGMQSQSQAAEAVGRIDTSGDGVLVWTEFSTAYQLRHADCRVSPRGQQNADRAAGEDGRGNGNRFAQVFILRSDQNGDGRLGRTEFRGSDSGFERMDKNGNGFIEPDELETLHQARLADPKSMRQRLQEGDLRRPPQDKQPEEIGKPTELLQRPSGRPAGGVPRRPSRQGPPGTLAPNGMGPGQAGLGRLASSGLEIGKPFPSIQIFDADGQAFSTEQLKGHDTVLVAACLTCPAFLRSYRGVEAVYRDYAPKGVKFYYVYRALAHPENNGIIKPFSVKERLMHVREAQERLKTQVPWLADNMNHDFKRVVGNTNNAEFLLDSKGCIVHMQMWSDGDRLRAALEAHVGSVDTPTTVADLGIPSFRTQPNTRGTVLPRIEAPGIMVPLKIEPRQNGQPFYVKLRAEAEQSVLEGGSGKIYLGFHIDPMYNTHWNNLAEPLHFEIKGPSGTTLSPGSGDGPKLDVESDSDPREFFVDLEHANLGTSLTLTVRYFACSDEPAWCKPVEQAYTIHVVRDEFGGAAFGRTFVPGGPPQRGPGRPGRARPAGGFGGQRPPGARPGSAGPPNAASLFSRFDKNIDGTLTESEVPAGLWQRLRNADANADGALTLEEFRMNRQR